VRNVVFLSAGGDSVRIRLTNTFGTVPMVVGHASVAVQSSGAAAVPGTVRPLTFGGQSSVTIAAGADALSDPVPLDVAPLSALLVSVYAPGPTGPVTNHPFTAQDNYLGSGDLTQQAGDAGYGDTPCWMLVDGVDVRAPGRVTGSEIIAADEQVAAQAHERGLRIYGATITPFADSIIDSPTAEQTRDAVNHWIMTSHVFDGSSTSPPPSRTRRTRTRSTRRTTAATTCTRTTRAARRWRTRST
jgi:hypothetical protein